MRNIRWIVLLMVAATVLCCMPGAAAEGVEETDIVSEIGNISGEENGLTTGSEPGTGASDEQNDALQEDGISVLAVTPSEITQSAFVDGVCTITAAGTYTLQEDVAGTVLITVDQSVVLNGNGHTLKPDPAHAAGQTYGVHVTDGTGSATIENFGNITGFSGPGIRSMAFRTTTIRNNVIYGCGDEPITSLRSVNCQGIYAASQKVVVTSNTVTDCGTPEISTTPGPGSYGILVMGYDGTVSNNTVTGCGKIAESCDGRTGSYGIYAKAGLVVSDNTVTDCGKVTTSGAEEVSGTGIFAHGGIVSGNTVTDCGKTVGAGGENIGNGIFGIAGTTIEKNTVTDSGFSNGESELSFGFGIRSEDGSIRDNVVTGCGRESPIGYGIQSVAGAEVTGNRVADSGIDCVKGGYGIFLSGGFSDLTLADNEVNGCGVSRAEGYGILAMNSGSRTGSKSVIRNNTIIGTSATAGLRLNSVCALTMTENHISAEGSALSVTGGMPGTSRIYNNVFNTSSYFHPGTTVAAIEKYVWNAETPVFERNIVGGEWTAGNWWGSTDGKSGYSDTHSSVKGFGKEAFEVFPGSRVYDAMPLCGLSESGGGELKITGGSGYTYDRTTTTYTITAPGEYWFGGSAHAKPVIIASDDVTLDGGYYSIMIFNRKTPRMTGIFAENRSNIIVKNCQVKYGDVGINVTGTDIVITGNTASGSALYGIYTGDATVTDNSVTVKAVGIHGSGIVSRNTVAAPIGIEITRDAEAVSVESNTVTSTTTGISVPSEWTGTATLPGNVVKSDATALEIHGGSGSVYNNLFSAETYVAGTAAASYTWNITPTDMAGRNIVLGKYVAGNYWTNVTGNGWSDSIASETGYSEAPFEVTAGVYDNAPLCKKGMPPVTGVELTEAGGLGYTYAYEKYTITSPGYYYFGTMPHLVSIESDDVVLDGREVLFTVANTKNVISTSGKKENVTVKNCYIDGGSIGIKVEGTDGTNVSVIDNTLRNTKSYGIYVKKGVVEGNVLTNCAYGGIGYHSIVVYDYARVTDNIVRGATKNGIYYSNTLSDGVGGAEITGNRVLDGRGDGISVTGKDGNTTVTGNTVTAMRHAGISVTPGTNNPDIEGATVRVLDNTVTVCEVGIDSTVKTLELTRGNVVTNCDTGISGDGELSGNTVQDCVVGIAVPAGAATPATITDNRVSGVGGCAVEVDGGSGSVYNNVFATPAHVRGSAAGAYAWNITPTKGENVVGGTYRAGNWWGSPDGTDGYSETNHAVNGYLGEDPANCYEPAPGACDYYPLVQTADLTLDPVLSVPDGDVVLDLPAVFAANYTGTGIDRYGLWTWTFTDAVCTDTQTSPTPQMEIEHTFTSPGPASVTLTVTDRDGQTAGTSRWEGVVGRSALKIGIENIDDGEAFAINTTVTMRADVPDLDDPTNATYAWECVGDDVATFSSPDAMETTVTFTGPGIGGIKLTVTPGGTDAEKYPAGSVVCTAVVTATPSVPTPPVPENPVNPRIDAGSPDVPEIIPEISVDRQDVDGDAGFTVTVVTPVSGEVPKFAADMGRPSDAFLTLNITPENLKDEKHLQYSAVFTVCIPASTVPENEKYNVRVYRFNTVSAAWEALPTTWVKTEAGVHHYEVKTPGFSVFTVVRAVPKAAPASSSGSDGWSDRETAVCNADGVARFNGVVRTVSLGSGAAGALVVLDGDIAITPAQEFYRVVAVTVRDSSVTGGADITFCVPNGVYENAGYSKDDIALALYTGENWEVQSTRCTGEEKGMTCYSAHIPAPGTVAVVYGKGITASSESAAGNTSVPTVTPTPMPTAPTAPEVVETAAPVITGTATATPTGAAPTPGFGIIAALAGAGAAALLAGRRD